MLSFVAERKALIAKQMAELDAKYNKTNNNTYTTALKKAKERLKATKDACDKCERAENELDAAYDESLKAHKLVEDISDDVLKIEAAETAYEAAKTAWNAANTNLSNYKASVKASDSDFEEAKATLLGHLKKWTCSPPESTIGEFDPLEHDYNITFDYQEAIKALNQEAAEVRKEVARLEGIVEQKKGDMDAKEGAWKGAKEESKAGKLCEPSFCTQTDLDEAKSESAKEDAEVKVKIGEKDTACAAIDQEEWGTEAPTASPK